MRKIKKESILAFIVKILLVIFTVVCFSLIDTVDNYIFFTILIATILNLANIGSYYTELIHNNKIKELTILLVLITLYLPVLLIVTVCFNSVLAIIICNLLGICIFIMELFNKDMKRNNIIRSSVLIYFIFILFIRRNNVQI